MSDWQSEMAALQERGGSDAPLGGDASPSQPSAPVSPAAPPITPPAAPFTPGAFTPPPAPVVGAAPVTPGAPAAPGAPPVDPNAPSVDPSAARPPQTPEEIQTQRDQLRAALGEERATTKNLKRQVEAAVAQQQRMAQNFEAMLMQMAAGTYRPPAAPGQPGSQPGVQPPAQGQPAGFRPIDLASIEANPLGALQQIAEMANAMQAQRAAEEAQRQRVQQQQQQAHYAQQQYIAQVSQVAAQMEDHEEEFRAVAPDYDDAAGFYVEHRMKELIVQGYSEERAYKAVEYEIINGAATALQQRLNPAKALYEAAKLRGFTGPRPMAVSPPAPHQPPAQVAPFPAVAAPAVDGDDNEWTDEAQDLIVNHAKMTLCRDQFRDPEGVQLAMGAVTDLAYRGMSSSRGS